MAHWICSAPRCHFLVIVVAFSLSVGVWGGEFQNLDFEQARVARTPSGQLGDFVDPKSAFPGWTVASNSVSLYNSLSLGTPAQVLVGPEFPNRIQFAPLGGFYSAYLQFGPGVLPSSACSLSQDGTVPTEAKSIVFVTSPIFNDARVTLDGVVIPLVSIGANRLAGDVSAFAGQEAELMFSTTSYNGPGLCFDDIIFSSQAIPEPSVIDIIGVTVVVLLGRMAWPYWVGGSNRLSNLKSLG